MTKCYYVITNDRVVINLNFFIHAALKILFAADRVEPTFSAMPFFCVEPCESLMLSTRHESIRTV